MKTDRPVPVICLSCKHVEEAPLSAITASLRCSCGSSDLDVFEPRTAAGPKEYSSASVPTHSAPPTIEGWNEYEGPMPGKNTESNGIPTPITCPVCHGSGFDPQDSEGGGFGGKCRTCHGTGFYTPMTSATPPMVARHPYPSTQTKVPFMGSPGTTANAKGFSDPMQVEYQLRHTDPQYDPQGPKGPENKQRPFNPNRNETFYPKAPERSRAINYRKPHDYDQATAKPFEMPGTHCPNCGHDPLGLRRDQNDDAWASCPNCGPLVNIDRHPEYDPYKFTWDTTFPKNNFKPKPTGKSAARKTGRLLSIIASVHQTNPGLSIKDAVTLARQTVQRY